MSKFENTVKLMNERCGNDKEVIIALATLFTNDDGEVFPTSRTLCAYYEDQSFYVSTDATSAKMLQIDKNNKVAVSGMEWFSFQGKAFNLGWVKHEKNADILAKFRKIFDWFKEVGDEDNPNSIILRIDLTEGTLIDNEKKFDESKYVIDFINKVAK